MLEEAVVTSVDCLPFWTRGRHGVTVIQPSPFHLKKSLYAGMIRAILDLGSLQQKSQRGHQFGH